MKMLFSCTWLILLLLYMGASCDAFAFKGPGFSSLSPQISSPSSPMRRPSFVVLRYKDDPNRDAEIDELDDDDEEEAEEVVVKLDGDALEDDVKLVTNATTSKTNIKVDPPPESVDDEASLPSTTLPTSRRNYKIPNDFKMFMTQCSLQSFMFLLQKMHDPQTLYWLERFTQPALVSITPSQEEESGGTDTGSSSSTSSAIKKSNFTFSLPNNSSMDDSGDLKLGRILMSKNNPATTTNATASAASTNATLVVKRKISNSPASSYLNRIGGASVVKRTVFTKPKAAAKNRMGNSYLDSMAQPRQDETPKDWSINSTTAANTRATVMSTNETTTLRSKSATTTERKTSDLTVSAALEEAKAGVQAGDASRKQERETQSSKLLQFHGLGAMNTTLFPTWEEFFALLLEQPSETLVIESPSPHVPDYDLDIDPASLCSRIVSVREQISREFSNDLQVIAEMGGKTLESYWETLKARRGENSTAGDDVKLQRENLLFLGMSAGSSDSSCDPSPLRKGNFDLLVLLCTQEAIHNVLNDEGRQEGPEKVINDYLADFYDTRLQSFFSGGQPYGRADDFLEELLGLAPRMMITAEEETVLIAPTSVAELILEERKAVALDWKQQAEESPMEHMVIQKMRLNRMMREPEAVDTEEGTGFQ